MISTDYYERLAQVESGGDPNAANPKSSARGLFQFTSTTAKQYGLEDPTDPVAARAAVEKFTADNAKVLSGKLGRQPTEGELYLAHQQGATGALKLLSNPDKKAIEVVGADQIKLNGGDENMTAGDFAAKWTGKFGDSPVSVENLTDSEVVAIQEPTGQQILLPDGNIIQLTGQETPQTINNIKQKIFDKYSAGNIDIDRKTGAPSSIRAIVGSVAKPEDKLATLRKYYPDTFSYGDDNFVFKNPENGKFTLYNPRGLDWGDAPSLAREAVQTVGQAAGTVAGGVVGFVAGGPIGSTAGGIAGAGLGVSTSGAMFDDLMNKFNLTIETRTQKEAAIQFVAETALGSVGEGVGRGLNVAVGKVVKSGKGVVSKIVGGKTPASKELLDTFQEFGIQPSASMVSQGAGIGRVESALSQLPASAEIIAKQADTIIEQTHVAIQSIIAKIGTPKTQQGAGETIRQSAVNAAERFGFKQEKIYTEVFDLIGGTSPVRVDALKELSLSMKSELARAPNSLKPALGDAIKYMNNLIADASNNGIEFGALRQIRTSIGRDLADPQLIGSSGSKNESMRRIYGALTDDMTRAAKSTSVEAGKKLATADRYTRIWMNTSAKTMEKIAKFDADERAYKFAISASKDGGSSLARLRRNFTPEEWDTVSATVLNEIGRARAGQTGEFSVATFLTNWRKLAPEAKDALFGGVRYKAQKESLEKLINVMEAIKDVSKYQNTSNTAGALQTGLLLTGLFGGGIGAVISGGDLNQTAQGAAVALSPYAASKLITSPKFIEWLATPLSESTKKAGKGAIFSMSEHIARLAFIAETEPELQEAIFEYTNVLENKTKE